MTRFKATEWMMRLEKGEMVPTITLKMLQEMLEKHHKDFALFVTGWNRSDVDHFLEINQWLYRGHVQYHHVKTCYSILKEWQRAEVLELLERMKALFPSVDWTEDDIRYFITEDNWVSPSGHKEHHIQAFYSMLKEMNHTGKIE